MKDCSVPVAGRWHQDSVPVERRVEDVGLPLFDSNLVDLLASSWIFVDLLGLREITWGCYKLGL